MSSPPLYLIHSLCCVHFFCFVFLRVGGLLIHVVGFFFPLLCRAGPTYKKVVFREYDEGFRQAKTHPSWLGKHIRLSRSNYDET